MTSPLIQVLAVDDDPAITRMIGSFLKKTGRYVVETENRSSHAMESARRVHPDIILLDFNMPGKGGLELAVEIAADLELKGALIVYVTGQLSAGEAARLERESPQNGILRKPFSPQQLIDKLDGIISRWKTGFKSNDV